ncbi:phosphorylase family protein [Hymenobacter puniceus]|uniref:phosphorylase family protein n=1 Tax=Hymenobacter sp. BT190 TaxID=2763505 RepID=UPI0016517E03|nr:response regulator [Hymenobacter sp. BT190]MBC6700101.1 response regulator [Hymenobacter sp. BT190]
MLKILLVEDNPAKMQKITNALVTCGVDIANIIHASSTLAALAEMQKQAYDVLLLDMMIPTRIDEESNPDGGIDLLAEITDRDNYLAPRYVIGITQHSELFEKNSEKFFNKNFSSIYYDEFGYQWKDQLIERINQILAASSATGQQSEHKTLACIICALDTIELQSVLNNGWLWEGINLPHDDTQYYKTVLTDRSGNRKEIHLAACARMGMPAAAALSMKMIQHFRPIYIIMCGIMAAIRGKANYGDVIVPEMLWDYGSGKITLSEDTRAPVFLQEPYQIYLDPTLKSYVNRIKLDEQLLFEIKRDFKFTKPSDSLSMHIGPVASGAAVLADGDSIKRVQEQHRKLIGIEMEAYAVFLAAQESIHPKPKSICIKSVVDFADENKDDRYHNYAAYTSSAIARELIEKHLM